MATNTIYRFLDSRPDKKSEELFVQGTGIRASTIWHDRYVSRMTPDQISSDRDIPLDAVYEALAFCQEEWENICREKDSEHQRLESLEFFEER
jgi:uncharacterized protein (DUF433 family)